VTGRGRRPSRSVWKGNVSFHGGKGRYRYHCLLTRRNACAQLQRPRAREASRASSRASATTKSKFWRERVGQGTSNVLRVDQSLHLPHDAITVHRRQGTRMAPAPASLKPIQPYLTKANEMKNADPVVSYYCSSPSQGLNADSAKATTGQFSMLFRSA